MVSISAVQWAFISSLSLSVVIDATGSQRLVRKASFSGESLVQEGSPDRPWEAHVQPDGQAAGSNISVDDRTVNMSSGFSSVDITSGSNHSDAQALPWTTNLKDEASSADVYSKLRAAVAEDGPQRILSDSGEAASWEGLLRENDAKGQQILKDFVEKHYKAASALKLNVKDTAATDRVAVFHLATGAHSGDGNHTLKMAEFAVKSTLHQLGEKWALQVFYTDATLADAFRERLGDAKNIKWTQMTHEGKPLLSTLHSQMSYFRMSEDQWSAIDSKLEHVLVFEADSMLLRGDGCIDEFLQYDYVGAPWANWTGYPKRGGNSGFSLRRRSAMMEALQSDFLKKYRGSWE
eukprot:TRINITY_DN23396_c0_g1_i4.p1 TRINITY_DN23396_c0_g1~~TRINITY_DN23396_c0_g1_i4.p1  ORF type:complete len:349 (+),score=85.14 TRINITY_DN23396_c0_g1_i4:129-1175(+)